jgi:hypothetical protein
LGLVMIFTIAFGFWANEILSANTANKKKIILFLLSIVRKSIFSTLL